MWRLSLHIYQREMMSWTRRHLLCMGCWLLLFSPPSTGHPPRCLAPLADRRSSPTSVAISGTVWQVWGLVGWMYQMLQWLVICESLEGSAVKVMSEVADCLYQCQRFQLSGRVPLLCSPELARVIRRWSPLLLSLDL